MALLGAMKKFNIKSDEWAVYQEQLDQFFVVNAIEDTQVNKRRVAALLSLIGSDTYKILRDLCTPSPPKDKTYEELCAMLKAHFSPANCVYRERIGFYAAQQEVGESIITWYARIHNLALNCEFGSSLPTVLKDKFICGLRKGKIRDRLCEEKPDKVNLEKLMEIAVSEEAAITAEGKEINLVKSNHKKERQQGRNSMEEYNGNEGKWTCMRCGNKHTGKCKYENYRCSASSKVDHLAKTDPMPKRIYKNKCCVFGCDDKWTKRHRFPKDAKMRQKWLQMINNPDLNTIAAKELYNKHFVCQKHFAEKYLVPGTKRGLRHDAIPTVFKATSPVQEEVEVLLESESLAVEAKPANTISTAVIYTFCEESAPSTSGTPKTIQVTRQKSLTPRRQK